MLQKAPMYDYEEPGMKTVSHIFTGGGAKAAWFKDPEGTSWRSSGTSAEP